MNSPLTWPFRDDARMPRTIRKGHSGLRVALAIAIGVCGLLPSPRPAAAQPLPILAGVAGGVAAGGWTTIGAFIARARMGNFVFDPHDIAQIRLETMPVLLFPLMGGLIGARSTDRLKAVGMGAGIGAAGGAILGVGVGALVGDTPEARWAGGIIGSGLGMLVGATVGGTRSLPSNSPPPGGGSISISIPIGGD